MMKTLIDFVAPASRRLSGGRPAHPWCKQSGVSALLQPAVRRLPAAGEDARRIAGGTPALPQTNSCNLRVPRAAPHGLALVEEELTGGHRTKLKRQHRSQFLVQALKHWVCAVSLTPPWRTGATSTSQSEMRTELVLFSGNAKRSRRLIH